MGNIVGKCCELTTTPRNQSFTVDILQESQGRSKDSISIDVKILPLPDFSSYEFSSNDDKEIIQEMGLDEVKYLEFHDLNIEDFGFKSANDTTSECLKTPVNKSIFFKGFRHEPKGWIFRF